MQALSGGQQIGRLEGKVSGLDEKVQGLDKKVDRLEVKVDGLEGRMDRFEAKMERLEAKMDTGFAAVRSEHRSDYRTLLGVQLTTIVAMILGFAGIILQHSL